MGRLFSHAALRLGLPGQGDLAIALGDYAIGRPLVTSRMVISVSSGD